MEAGPLLPLGIQKSLACQECAREMADSQRRAPHPIKANFCSTHLSLGSLFFIPAWVGRAVCTPQFPMMLPSISPPPWSPLSPMVFTLQNTGCPVRYKRRVRTVLATPSGSTTVLCCFNLSHHSLNNCSLLPTHLLALDTDGGIKNVVVNESKDVSDLDGCCSLTRSHLFTK